jgi:anti-sigma B factor antagonist
LKFNERTIAGATVLDLEGRLTFTSGAEMRRLVEALVVGGVTQLVLNLERVSYVDSAGLGAMIEAFTAARHKAVRLTLLNPTERTRHLLEITGLARIVETFDSEAAALASCETVEDTDVDRESCPQCGVREIVLSLLTSMTRYFACRRCHSRWEVAVVAAGPGTGTLPEAG